MSSLFQRFVIIVFCGFWAEVLSVGVAPTWLTSSYVQADTNNIITTLTGSTMTPTATLNFVTAFSSLPNIGYGIIGYVGDDFLGQQFFEINKTGLTLSSFSVAVQIYGITNLWLMKMRYIAIDAAFPHKLNSYDNVPVNYSNGEIVNISTKSSSLTYYTNTINFTAHSIATGQNFFTSFSSPFTNNKILLFMTSIYQGGTNGDPFMNTIDTKIMTNQTYLINSTWFTLIEISRLHFSMIIFDQADVLSSQMYQLVYQKIVLPGAGGFIPIPQEFITNLIIGLVQFNMANARTQINFNLSNQTNSNGIYGINMPFPTIRNNPNLANNYSFTLFYMKTWLCPNTSFFNILTDLCQYCSLPNCLQCQNLTRCLICDNSTNLNNSTGLCQVNSSLCGDGIYQLPQECDDGNSVDGDGCSSTCNVQVNYTCQSNPSPNMLDSVCFYIGDITLNVVYIEKMDSTNQLQILLEIGPKGASFWNGVDFSKMVTLSNMTGFQNYTVRMNSDGTVSIIANYNTTIQNMNITVQLDPAQSGKNQLSRYPTVSKDFEIIPTDNELALFYDNSVYEIAKATQILSFIVAASSLFFFVLSIFADKLVGVEMMAVIQISHLSLITLDNMNPCFKALANIWFVNGFNIFSLSKDYLLDPYTPNKVKGIYLYSYFIQNYNFTILLIVLPLIISLLCFIMSINFFNLNKRKEIREFAKRCVCEYSFTGLMFSGYIVSVALALEMLFGVKNMNGIIPILSAVKLSVVLVLMILYFVMKILTPKHFGQFTEKFTVLTNLKLKELQNSDIKESTQPCKEKIPRFHYNFLILERIIVGSCLVFMMDLKFGLLLPISLFSVFIAETIILRPYNNQKHNVRFISNMVISIIVLAIYLAHNATDQNTRIQSQAWIYLPLAICVLLLICIVYSAIFLIQSLIKRVTSQCSQDKYNVEQQLKQYEKYFQKQNETTSKRKITVNDTEYAFQNTNHKQKLQQIRRKVISQVGLQVSFKKVCEQNVIVNNSQYLFI